MTTRSGAIRRPRNPRVVYLVPTLGRNLVPLVGRGQPQPVFWRPKRPVRW